MFSILIVAFALQVSVALPMPKHIEPIRYPEAARAAHWEGTVTVHLELDRDGRVTQFSAKGRPIFADAIKACVNSWRFGMSGQNSTDIVFQFKLIGKPRWPAHAETFVTYDLPDKITVVSQPTFCDHCRDSAQ